MRRLGSAISGVIISLPPGHVHIIAPVVRPVAPGVPSVSLRSSPLSTVTVWPLLLLASIFFLPPGPLLTPCSSDSLYNGAPCPAFGRPPAGAPPTLGRLVMLVTPNPVRGLLLLRRPDASSLESTTNIPEVDWLTSSKCKTKSPAAGPFAPALLLPTLAEGVPPNPLVLEYLPFLNFT